MAEELTHESVQEEMHRIHNDPAHPHHEGYKKGLSQSVAYVDGLYQRIPGGEEKVELGEGITLEGTLVDTPGAAASADRLPLWAEDAKYELGDQWDAAVEKLGAVGEKLFGGDEKAEAAFMNKMRAAGWTDRQIFDAALKLG